MAGLQRGLKKVWFPPKGNESKPVTVNFKVHQDGSISNVSVEKSSGLQIADAAAVQAVRSAILRPLPPGSPDSVDVQYKFDYNLMAAGAPRRFMAFNSAAPMARYGYGGMAAAGGGSSSIVAAAASNAVSGEEAVSRSKQIANLKSSSTSDDAGGGIRTAGDKTFTLRNGVWTDTTVPDSPNKVETINFGSTRYFDLTTAEPELAKYFGVGEQVLVLYKGHCYRILPPSQVDSQKQAAGA
jgi:TonB family protein